MRDPFTIDRAKALSGVTELADLEDVDDEQLVACLDDYAGDGVEVIHSQATAYVNGWLGEAQGLRTSLQAARGKLASLSKAVSSPGMTTDLGMPIIGTKQTGRPTGRSS